MHKGLKHSDQLTENSFALPQKMHYWQRNWQVANMGGVAAIFANYFLRNMMYSNIFKIGWGSILYLAAPVASDENLYFCILLLGGALQPGATD